MDDGPAARCIFTTTPVETLSYGSPCSLAKPSALLLPLFPIFGIHLRPVAIKREPTPASNRPDTPGAQWADTRSSGQVCWPNSARADQQLRQRWETRSSRIVYQGERNSRRTGGCTGANIVHRGRPAYTITGNKWTDSWRTAARGTRASMCSVSIGRGASRLKTVSRRQCSGICQGDTAAGWKREGI